MSQMNTKTSMPEHAQGTCYSTVQSLALVHFVHIRRETNSNSAP